MLKIIPFLALLLCFSCMDDEPKNETGKTSISAEKATKARIKTVHGDIVLKFFPKDAPNTVTRIKELIAQGFYNGITFHRVIPGFVVQGGDPTGTGMHGSGKKLKAEFNQKKHVPGAVAMARAQDPDSADSQFYISLGTHPHLDGKYTIFGNVEKGLEVAQKIVQGDKIITFTLE
jgi:peptidylprolyl isomerase